MKTRSDFPLPERLLNLAADAKAGADGQTAMKAISWLIMHSLADSGVGWRYQRKGGARFVGDPFADLAVLQCGDGSVSFPIGALSKDYCAKFARAAVIEAADNSFGAGILDGFEHQNDGSFEREFRDLDADPVDSVLESDSEGRNTLFRTEGSIDYSNRGFHEVLVQIGLDAQVGKDYDTGNKAFALLYLCALKSPEIEMRYQTDFCVQGEDRDATIAADLCVLRVPDLPRGRLKIPADKLTKGALLLFLRSAQQEERFRPPGGGPRRFDSLPQPQDFEGEFRNVLGQWNAEVPDNLLEAS